MGDLKLPKLPDRTPVKLTITLSADLHQALKEYAARYELAYGVAEQVGDLVPYIVEAFLAADKGFARTVRK